MIDKPSRQPLYHQVKDILLDRIGAGEWPDGTFLPSELALAREYGVSQGTIRIALNKLTSESRLVRYQGKGTAVPAVDASQYHCRFFQIVNSAGQREYPASRILTCQLENASRHVAERLLIDAGDNVLTIDRVRVLAGRAVINETIFLPCARLPGIESHGTTALSDTLYDFLRKKFRITIVSVKEEARAVVADAMDAKRLGVAVGSPLLEIHSVALNLERRPIEFRTSRFNTSAYACHIDLR